MGCHSGMCVKADEWIPMVLYGSAFELLEVVLLCVILYTFCVWIRFWVIIGQSGGCVSVLAMDDGTLLYRTPAHKGKDVTAVKAYSKNNYLLSSGEFKSNIYISSHVFFKEVLITLNLIIKVRTSRWWCGEFTPMLQRVSPIGRRWYVMSLRSTWRPWSCRWPWRFKSLTASPTAYNSTMWKTWNEQNVSKKMHI